MEFQRNSLPPTYLQNLDEDLLLENEEYKNSEEKKQTKKATRLSRSRQNRQYFRQSYRSRRPLVCRVSVF